MLITRKTQYTFLQNITISMITMLLIVAMAVSKWSVESVLLIAYLFYAGCYYFIAIKTKQQEKLSFSKLNWQKTIRYHVVFIVIGYLTINLYNIFPYYQAGKFKTPVDLIQFYFIFFCSLSILEMLLNRKKIKPVESLVMEYLVKFFFVPLMLVYLTGNIQAIANFNYGLFQQPEKLPKHIFDWLTTFLFTLDLFVAVVGYTLSSEILGNRVRSIQPTFFGWFIALICYEPFYQTTKNYFSYDNGYYWGHWLWDNEIVYVIWGSFILLFHLIFALSSVSLGVHFSNLSNKGVVTNGLYKYTKHPAYLSKCSAFFMINVPFVIQGQGGGSGMMFSLFGFMMICLIYWLRAKTEEQHMSEEYEYRVYMRYIDIYGLFAKPKRFIQRLLKKTPQYTDVSSAN